MRVIAGAAKGRKLRAAEGTRPTTDRVKEALFSSLGSRVPGRRVLDLYAGSGALGIEALSRGANSATFVEQSRLAAQALLVNLAATGFEDRAAVVLRSVEAVLAEPPEEPFDLVLADSPYAEGLPGETLELLRDHGWLADNATVVLEVAGRLEHIEIPTGYLIRDTRRYGDSKLVYLSRYP